jgi:hypothetical protein
LLAGCERASTHSHAPEAGGATTSGQLMTREGGDRGHAVGIRGPERFRGGGRRDVVGLLWWREAER